MVGCQCQNDIVAVLPWLELAAVDVVVAHASAKSNAAEAANTAGWTAARAEHTERKRFRKDVPDHAAFRFVPFPVGTCGYMGKEAVKFVNRLGDIAARSGRIPKGKLVHWAMQQLLVTVHQGNASILLSYMYFHCRASVGGSCLWQESVQRWLVFINLKMSRANYEACMVSANIMQFCVSVSQLFIEQLSSGVCYASTAARSRMQPRAQK